MTEANICNFAVFLILLKIVIQIILILCPHFGENSSVLVSLEFSRKSFIQSPNKQQQIQKFQ